jgi:glycosyltransferase involved in cell wall biosynthesis
VLFAGRLVPQKRPDLLVEAFARASASRAGAASLVLLGEGELRPAIEAAARRSSTRVILPGAIRDTAPWLRAADLFVLPSSFEGFPNALLEAAATGLGCIATPVGAVEEVVRDGETGLLAEGTAPALAAAIVRLLDDEPLRARLGAAARAHAAARFGIDGLAASYLGLYTEVVAEHRAAPR